MYNFETPGENSDKPRPKLKLDGQAPRKSRLGEMMAGQMIQRVSDAEFNSMFGLDGNDYV